MAGERRDPSVGVEGPETKSSSEETLWSYSSLKENSQAGVKGHKDAISFFCFCGGGKGCGC